MADSEKYLINGVDFTDQETLRSGLRSYNAIYTKRLGIKPIGVSDTELAIIRYIIDNPGKKYEEIANDVNFSIGHIRRSGSKLKTLTGTLTKVEKRKATIKKDINFDETRKVLRQEAKLVRSAVDHIVGAYNQSKSMGYGLDYMLNKAAQLCESRLIVVDTVDRDGNYEPKYYPATDYNPETQCYILNGKEYPASETILDTKTAAEGLKILISITGVKAGNEARTRLSAINDASEETSKTESGWDRVTLGVPEKSNELPIN